MAHKLSTLKRIGSYLNEKREKKNSSIIYFNVKFVFMICFITVCFKFVSFTFERRFTCRFTYSKELELIGCNENGFLVDQQSDYFHIVLRPLNRVDGKWG